MVVIYEFLPCIELIYQPNGSISRNGYLFSRHDCVKYRHFYLHLHLFITVSDSVLGTKVPRTHTGNKVGDRSFSAAGPRVWNDLPRSLRRPGLSFNLFRRSPKTHLFGD